MFKTISSKRVWGLAMGLAIATALILPCHAVAEGRGVKVRVNPTYPELAKRMSVSGTVKMEVTVAPNGTVKSVKVIGGHPLLIDAATDAVKRWKYEPAAAETNEQVEIRFDMSE